MQTASNCHTIFLSRICIQVGWIFSTPHFSAQIPRDGSPLLVGIQLPLVIGNRTHKTIHKRILFLHHSFDLCARSPLQSIFPSIASFSVAWLVHHCFYSIFLLQAHTLTTFCFSFHHHHRWTRLQTSSFIVELVS